MMINYSDSRRQFLKRMALGFSASLLFKGSPLWANQKSIHIANIEVFPVNYPMTGRFKFFEGLERQLLLKYYVENIPLPLARSISLATILKYNLKK